MTKYLALLLVVGCATETPHSNAYTEGRLPGSAVTKTLLGSAINVTAPVSGSEIKPTELTLLYDQLVRWCSTPACTTYFYETYASGTSKIQFQGSGGVPPDVGVGSVTASATTALNISSSGGRLTWSTAGRFVDSNEATGNLRLNSFGLTLGTAGAAYALLEHGFIFNTTPTISSGFGSSASIVASNGTIAIKVNVGTGGVATTGVIGLPTATTGWFCTCEDVTTQSTTVARTRQTGVGTTTTCPIGNFTSADVAGAWVASDILLCNAVAY